MVGSSDVIRIKCGQIYILSDDNFSLICEFCDNEFLTLVELRDHLLEHFPKTPKNIKKEESLSSDSDCEITSWDLAAVKEEILADDQQVENDFEFIKVEGLRYHEEFAPPLLEKTQYSETSMNNEQTIGSEDQACSKEILENGNVDKPNEKSSADLQSSSNQEKEGTSRPKDIGEANSSYLYSNRLRKKNKPNTPPMVNPNNENDTDSEGTSDYTEPNRSDIPDDELQTKLPFECGYCSERFKHDRNRNYHENTHTGKLPQCRECSKTFVSLEKLTQHLKKHKNVLQCKVCKETFRYKSALVVHRLKHRPKKVRRGKHIPCMLCNVKLTTPHHLSLHMAAHKRKAERKNEIFTCEYCRKQFKKKEAIVSHLQTHSGIMPFKCSNCGKAFSRFPYVQKHEMYCFRKSAHKEKSK